jgi:hypothetical protein
VDLAGIGWCWQPTVVVVNRGWQPYCDRGHWLYCSSGWYWQSEYSWGWAPFHYGRWQLHPRCGWVWSPDTVWGPAWVTWRTVGNNCGWAPLPPHAVFQAGVGWRYNGVTVSATFGFGLQANCFTFVGLNNFNNRDLSHARLAPVEVTKIYNHTTIINNYTVNNTTVINHGIPVERVSAVATTPVHRATVREAAVGSGRTITTTPAAEKGETVVYRSQLKAPVRSAPVVVQKVDDRHPVIRHTPTVQVAAPRNPTYTGSGRQGQQPAENSYGNAANRPTYTTPSQQAPRTPQSAPVTPSRSTSPTANQPAPRVSQSAPNTPTYPAQTTQHERTSEVQPDSRSTEASTRTYQAPANSQNGNPHLSSPKGHEQNQGKRQPTQTAPPRQNPPPQSQPGNSGNSKSNNSGS